MRKGALMRGVTCSLGSLFFAVSAQGATIDRIVRAGSLEDIPAVDSDQWRSLGYTSPDGMFAAHHCHRLKKPAPPQPAGLWSRFAALFHDDPRPHPLAERWDCRGGLSVHSGSCAWAAQVTQVARRVKAA